MQGEINPTVGWLWEKMVQDCAAEWTKGTVTTYNTSWKCLKPFWENKTTIDVNDSMIMQFREWYLQEHPTRQARKTIQHLNKCFKFAHKNGHLKQMPKNMEKVFMLDGIVKKNNAWEKKGRALTIPETKILVKAIDEFREEVVGHGATSEHRSMLKSRIKLAIFLGVFCGMRKKEISNLKWSKVDFKKRLMNVWSFKNHSWREVTFPKMVEKELKEMHKVTGQLEWVFPMPSDQKRCVSGQILDKGFYHVREIANLEEHVMFHDLRRTFATRTGEWGWPPQQACKHLDMSLDNYMKNYCKPSTLSKQQLMDKTEELLNIA